MKVSVFVPITNAIYRRDAYIEAISSYCRWADEIVVVDGATEFNKDLETAKLYFHPSDWQKIKWVMLPWPYEFHWREFPLHYQEGLKHCTGDWVFAMCIDYLFHENDFARVREKLANSVSPLISFQKTSLLFGGKYFSKGQYPLAMNMRMYPNLGFGKPEGDNSGDWVYPIFVDGYDDDGVGLGKHVPQEYVERTDICYWNYDATFRNKTLQTEHFWRLAMARHATKGRWEWGKSPEEAYDHFLSLMRDRLTRIQGTLTLNDHSTFIRKRIETLTPDQFGYDGWGLFS